MQAYNYIFIMWSNKCVCDLYHMLKNNLLGILIMLLSLTDIINFDEIPTQLYYVVIKFNHSQLKCYSIR